MNRFQAAFKVLKGVVERELTTRSSYDLFGTIGRQMFPIPTTKDFIPVDAHGDVLDLRGTNTNAAWLGLENKMMQYWAYNYCSPLAAVIDRLAEADTNGKIEFVNDDGDTIKNIRKIPILSRVKKLLDNPNPFQTWHEFNSQQVVLCKIFGYCPVFFVSPEGMDKSYTKYIFNINPFLATPTINYDFDLYNELPPIKSWSVRIYSQHLEMDSKDILLIKDGYIHHSIQTDGLPISKIAGLDYFVSNICAAMEADNVLLKKKGPLGIFSYDPKLDMAGSLPLNPKQKDELHEALKNYGLTLGQLQYVISKIPVKWNSMSYNLRDLMTKETVRQGIDGICDRFGYPAELMSGKNAKYENRDSAEKFLYQNNVIPFSLRRMNKYNDFLGITGSGYNLNLDYQDLPVLQEDLLKSGQSRLATSNSVQVDWVGGLITWNEARLLLELDTVPGMDIYYSEYIKKYQSVIPINNTKTIADAKVA